MFPTIYGIALTGLGDDAKPASAFLIMAIVGGAVIPYIFGTIVDAVKITEEALVGDYQTAYWVMVPCYIFILYFAISGHKVRTKS